MSLAASCPRCAAGGPHRRDSPDAANALEHGRVDCPVHGLVWPFWRADDVGYDEFAELIDRVDDLPTYLPWPMSPGWSIADFGCVNGDAGSATITATTGSSDLDGPVEVTIVAEDPGVGLGARCAGTTYPDPALPPGAPAIRVRAGGRTVPLWVVETDEDHDLLERAVFAGEADGRWLWIVVRPASAALLLHDTWLLADVTGFGPEALEMPFGGPRPPW